MSKRFWLVLPDPFSTRVFVDCGIVAGLAERLPGRVQVVLALHRDEAQSWTSRLGDVPWTLGADLFPDDVGVGERITRRVDLAIDRNAGYYPLSVRQSLRHGFNRERMRPGHPNLFLNSSLTGRLPGSETLDGLMRKWLYSSHRFVSKTLLSRMRDSCSGLIVANVQSLQAVPFLLAARRFALPVVGYVASWDHTVGKGIVSSHITRYVVQNDVMRDDLVRFHGVPHERIAITGWPQTDIFHERRTRAAFDGILQKLGLDPARPVVLVAGNSPTNTPYEGPFVDRLVGWWKESGAALQLLFRPHPRDREWRERLHTALEAPGVAVQEPSYTDLKTLATLLQHVNCVVANAGTILLDSIVNDRPSVCVLYDEGAPPGERHAELNVTGLHYDELIRSEAFLRASDLDGVISGIARALKDPGEFAAERRRVAYEVVGVVDGHAADRVVDAIVEVVA
jgi:hypothetical protein